MSRASGKLSNLLNGGAEDRRCSCLLFGRNTWQLVEVKQTTCHSNERGRSYGGVSVMGNVVLRRPSAWTHISGLFT